MGVPQFRRRVDAEFVAQQLPHAFVHREGIGLPPGRGQRPHAQRRQPLTQRMFGAGDLQIRENICVAAQLEFGRESVLDGRRPQIIQPGGDNLHERGILHIPEYRSAPQSQRLPQQPRRNLRPPGRELPPPALDQILEPLGIHLDPGQPIPTGRELHRPRLAQGAPQPRYQGLQRTRRVTGRLLTPEPVDQRRRRYRPARLEREPGQQHAHPDPADLDRRSRIRRRLNRPQHIYPHRASLAESPTIPILVASDLRVVRYQRPRAAALRPITPGVIAARHPMRQS